VRHIARRERTRRQTFFAKNQKTENRKIANRKKQNANSRKLKSEKSCGSKIPELFSNRLGRQKIGATKFRQAGGARSFADFPSKSSR
jgi:hypothetical protein